MDNFTKKINGDKEQGFTLVELSIVLVIIGLIVGGVLVGQDMIRAAEIRATVAQMEEFNSAVNTFRDKYNNYPGDILAVEATSFGFTTRAGTGGRGDGDRLMEGCSSGLLFGCETGLFWRDLNQAGFIKGSTTVATDSGNVAVATGALSTFFPEAEIGLGHYITTFSATGRNWFQIARISSITASGAVGTGAPYVLENAMSPQTAFQLDQKLDDGLPLTGIARAAYSTSALNAISAANASIATGTAGGGTVSDCINGDATTTTATDPYNTANDTNANQPACQLVVRTSF